MPVKSGLYRRRLGPECPPAAEDRCLAELWSLHNWCDDEWTGRRTCRRCRGFYMRRSVGPCVYCGYPVWHGEWGSDVYELKMHGVCQRLRKSRNWRPPKGAPNPVPMGFRGEARVGRRVLEVLGLVDKEASAG